MNWTILAARLNAAMASAMMLVIKFTLRRGDVRPGSAGGNFGSDSESPIGEKGSTTEGANVAHTRPIIA